MSGSQTDIIQAVRQNSIVITEKPSSYDRLYEDIADAGIVLIGEATHGTHEFYQTRAQITAHLIKEKGFAAVAVEADWPDAYRVNRYVRSIGDMNRAVESLSDFKRFPLWMWRNAEVLEFIEFLREHNDLLPQEKKAGFYGLDLYSLYTSIEAVIQYLEDVNPRDAELARDRYSCFEQYGPEADSYGMATAYIDDNCKKEAVAQLKELRNKSHEYLKNEGFVAREELFYTEQNAKLAIDAEEYYRTMFEGRVSNWNLRDTHMADTLDALIQHIGITRDPKIVVWEHNSHLGDARATEVTSYGEINVGQLVRERYNEKTYSIGFTTHSGTVSAASHWGSAVEKKSVNPSLPESYENIFHKTGIPAFYLLLRDGKKLDLLKKQHLERAIGVVYSPKTERHSHYFRASLPEQFDAVIHFDHTTALVPID